MELSKTSLAVIGVLVVLLLVAAFGLGNLYTKIQVLQGDGGMLAQDARGGGTNAPQVPTGQAGEIAPITEADHIRGSSDAKLALIEYSDLECPYCKQYHATLQSMVNDYPEEVMWVYRHFPLESLHPKAPTESQAAECAARLGGEDTFWAFIDKIYEVTPSNNGLDLTTLPDLAAGVGLDPNAFADCVDSGQMDELVQEDIDSGTKAGVNGTPGSVLMNLDTGEKQLISGAIPYTSLKSTIDGMLGSQ